MKLLSRFGLGLAPSIEEIAVNSLPDISLPRPSLPQRAIAYGREALAAHAMSKKFALLKNPEISADDIVRLHQEIRQATQLVRIAPDTFKGQALFEQIIRNEQVHPIRDTNDLLEHRLGMEGTNKDCQALTVTTRQGQQILAQIFRYHVEVDVEAGMVDLQNLPGNVDLVKSSSIDQLTGKENVTGYWTISSEQPENRRPISGIGRDLVGALIKATPQGRFETTISPCRGLYKRLDIMEIRNMDPQDARQAALEYLLDRKDPVLGFHVGNGAYIGWIHFNPQSETDPIVINYVYDRASAARNAALFNRGKGQLPISPALYHMIDSDQQSKAFNIYGGTFVPMPGVFAKPAPAHG